MKKITIIKTFIFAGNRYFCYSTGKDYVCLCNNKTISKEQFKTAYKGYKHYNS